MPEGESSYDGRMPQPGDELDWKLDSLEALRRWPADEPVLMLHSGRADARWSRYTLLTRAQGAYRFGTDSQGEGLSEWIGESVDAMPEPGDWSHRPLKDLGRVLADRDALWVGYLGYDIGRDIEKLPSHAMDDRGWPIVQMHRCPGWLVYDNVAGKWSACGSWCDTSDGWIADLPNLPVQSHRFFADAPQPHVQRPDYLKALERSIEYIAAGDIFQVNLTQRFTARSQGDPRALYEVLADRSPAWYGAYLELSKCEGEITRTIASTSPELFFQVDSERRVITRPIKGTRPAHVDPDELRRSSKDAAELTMIVDLLRNDLGRVCDYGSVRVPEPRIVESHPTVHHTTATVTGKLHASKTLIDLIRAVMPGGSITGAPKVRAMQIIDELEPVRRGPYTGAIGFIQGDTACLNIAIRTMLVETDEKGVGRVDYGVGGGIVADSIPADEYQETLDKAAAMNAALKACARSERAKV